VTKTNLYSIFRGKSGFSQHAVWRNGGKRVVETAVAASERQLAASGRERGRQSCGSREYLKTCDNGGKTCEAGRAELKN